MVEANTISDNYNNVAKALLGTERELISNPLSVREQNQCCIRRPSAASELSGKPEPWTKKHRKPPLRPVL